MGHNFGHRGNTHHYAGKPREEYHPYDRKSGTGRGYENKREGHGKGNWGNEKMVYKKKGETAEEQEEPIVPQKEEGEYPVEEGNTGEGQREYRAPRERGGYRGYAEQRNYGDRGYGRGEPREYRGRGEPREPREPREYKERGDYKEREPREPRGEYKDKEPREYKDRGEYKDREPRGEYKGGEDRDDYRKRRDEIVEEEEVQGMTMDDYLA